MRTALIILSTGLLLAGCSRNSEPTVANPHNHCVGQGLERGSDEFRSCVDDFIATTCVANGHEPGSKAYAGCDDQLRQATFLRQQMEIFGR